MDIDPDILEAFHNSTAVSTQHGSSVALLKTNSKRRRTKAEMEVLKNGKQENDAVLENQKAEIMFLQ